MARPAGAGWARILDFDGAEATVTGRVTGWLIVGFFGGLLIGWAVGLVALPSRPASADAAIDQPAVEPGVSPAAPRKG